MLKLLGGYCSLFASSVFSLPFPLPQKPQVQVAFPALHINSFAMSYGEKHAGKLSAWFLMDTFIWTR